MKRAQNKQHGITLMELMAVLSVAAILVALTIPLYSDYFSQNRLRSAGEELYQHMIKARAEAIKQQATITVVLQTGSNWCYGVTTATTCDCAPASVNVCNLGYVNYSTNDSVDLNTIGVTGSSVNFEGVRGTVSAIADLTFTNDDGEVLTIKLNKMGYSRLCSSDLNGYSAC